MSQARTNARRRKQAAQNYSHLAPRQRPNYKRRDVATSSRKEELARKKLADMRARGYKGK